MVGENARRLRGAATQQQVAEAARRFGARWNGGRVSKIEEGKQSLTLDSFVVLAAALSDVLGRAVELAELVVSGPVIPTGKFMVNGKIVNGPELIDVESSEDEQLEGLPVGTHELAMAFSGNISSPRLRESEPVASLTEKLASSKLEMHVETVRQCAHRLWGHDLTTERAHRIAAWESEHGSTATAQLRGWITRSLMDEIRDYYPTLYQEMTGRDY